MQVQVLLPAPKEYAGVVELADTYDSGSYAVTSMQVQVLSPAPKASKSEWIWELFCFIQSEKIGLAAGKSKYYNVKIIKESAV